jgi:methylenetetrahydrofolate dehydrogenase (NADP+)/methenyltetrahydrofolate cyclohydrolase
MTARIIDGKAIAAAYRAECKLRVDRLAQQGVRPGLAVVLVGDDPASQVYVRNKARACEETGIRSEVHRLAESTTQAELLAHIARLNADRAIHGILVQLPLPRSIDNRAVIEAIDPARDVDGFHLSNVGRLVVGNALYPPCTPWGVMKMLEHEGIAVSGADAVIVGRSLIVGKPMAFLLIDAGATVTVCHSKTRDLAAHCRRADILVAAAGRARMIGADWVKPGATVIDVGINRLPDGKLAGDVDFDAVVKVAGAITPVPGGVGPMTIAMLLGNTVRAAELAAGRASSARETRIA